MIYVVRVLYRGYNNAPPEYVAVTADGLFHLAMMMSRSPDVTTFSVSEGQSPISPSAFGWGPIEKWKRNLYE
jgi:hypothetical protein